MFTSLYGINCSVDHASPNPSHSNRKWEDKDKEYGSLLSSDSKTIANAIIAKSLSDWETVHGGSGMKSWKM